MAVPSKRPTQTPIGDSRRECRRLVQNQFLESIKSIFLTLEDLNERFLQGIFECESIVTLAAEFVNDESRAGNPSDISKLPQWAATTLRTVLAQSQMLS